MIILNRQFYEDDRTGESKLEENHNEKTKDGIKHFFGNNNNLTLMFVKRKA